MKHHKDSKRGQYPHLAKASLILLGTVLIVGITSHIERGVWSKKLTEAVNASAVECQERVDAGNELKLTDNIVVRSNHRGPSNLCYFSEEKLRQVLSMNHSCGLGEQRYYVQGSWINWDSLYWDFEKPRDQAQSDYVEGDSDCILACKDDPSLNCSTDMPCLHAFYLRRNSTDTLVVRQLYEAGEHGFLKPEFKLKSILDAGANVGIASVLFATMYPQARIIAVEASSRNFRSLLQNARPYPNIIPINVALWPRVAALSLTLDSWNLKQRHDWGYVVRETKQVQEGQTIVESLQGVSVSFVMNTFGIQEFDFLKIDIEGGERHLFGWNSNVKKLGWVDASKVVALELHPWVEGSVNTVFDYFNKKKNFVYKNVTGEYDVFVRKDSGFKIEAAPEAGAAVGASTSAAIDSAASSAARRRF